jgi:hypothetical protein
LLERDLGLVLFFLAFFPTFVSEGLCCGPALAICFMKRSKRGHASGTNSISLAGAFAMADDFYTVKRKAVARYDIPAPLAREIGRFLVTWAHFEHYVQAVVWSALQISEEQGRINDFEIITRSRSVPVAVSSRMDLERLSVALLRNEMPLPKPVRLLGLSLSSLHGDHQTAASRVPDLNGCFLRTQPARTGLTSTFIGVAGHRRKIRMRATIAASGLIYRARSLLLSL